MGRPVVSVGAGQGGSCGRCGRSEKALSALESFSALPKSPQVTDAASPLILQHRCLNQLSWGLTNVMDISEWML